jgi:DNA repair photolyase
MEEFGSFYKSIEDRKYNTWCRYTKRIDTYGRGCQHNCSYCYAKSLLTFRGLWNSDSPAMADASKIKARIRTIDRRDVVKLGGMTDCFQPIERERRNTLKTILMLNQFKISYLIVTKSDMVADSEYMDIYDPSLAHFQITITATDAAVSARYENAPAPDKRIKAIETLSRRGFDVSVRLSPFFIQNIDVSVINNIACDKILIEFLKVNHWVKKWFAIDYAEYSLSYGGYQHLPLEKKVALAELITGYGQKSIGEYVSDHYDYFSANVNYNKDDCCNLRARQHESVTQKTLF